MVERDAIGLVTGLLGRGTHRQKLADIVNIEAQLARMADEVEAVHLIGPVTALPALSAGRLGQKADLLIEADGGHFDGGALRQLTDRQIHHFGP